MPWHLTIMRVLGVYLIWTEFSDTKGYQATLVLIKGKSFVKQIVQPRAMARTFKVLDFYSLSISLFPMMLAFKRTLIPYCFYLLACTLSEKTKYLIQEEINLRLAVTSVGRNFKWWIGHTASNKNNTFHFCGPLQWTLSLDFHSWGWIPPFINEKTWVWGSCNLP